MPKFGEEPIIRDLNEEVEGDQGTVEQDLEKPEDNNELKEEVRKKIEGIFNQEDDASGKEKIDSLVEDIMAMVRGNQEEAEKKIEELKKTKEFYEKEISTDIKGLFDAVIKWLPNRLSESGVTEAQQKIEIVQEKIGKYNEIAEAVQSNQFNTSIDLLKQVKGMITKGERLGRPKLGGGRSGHYDLYKNAKESLGIDELLKRLKELSDEK